MHKGAHVSIRPAEPSDEEALARINRAAWALGDRPPPVERLRDAFAERIASRDRTLLVAEEGEEVKGFVSFGKDEVHALYVDPEAQQRGTGRALLERALAEMRAAGAEEATIWSLAVNARASAFYEASGFARDGAERGGEMRFRKRL